ncbi:GerAB/ArcD/ProY family transporter [Desulfofalx alkaliphila]|uniref:GerAB/ArcD/ProY family transporter n=1 Tax=Desulfofalx alkaliphila TaxID=105483 RepID=UPI0004E0C622|nr:endospore germination permease [Desulfofalx alkaliphila]
MKKHHHNSITLMQYIFIIVGTQVGVGIFSLPVEVAETAGTDGWMSIILGWFVAVLVSLAIINVMKRHPNDTVFDLLKRYFGKWLGGIGIGLWIIYTAFAAFTVIMMYIHILQIWVLPVTSTYMLAILLLVPMYMVARDGVRVIGRYAELIFFLAIWIPFLILSNITESRLIYILPPLKEGLLPVIAATRETLFAFLGFELAFLFYSYLDKKEYAIIGVIAANTISMMIFLMITLTSFTYFSPDEILQYIWPTLMLLKPIEFTIIERFEILILTFYLFVVSTTVIPYLFTAAFGTGLLFKLQSHKGPLKVFILMFIGVSYIVYFDRYLLGLAVDTFSKMGLIFAYLFPVLLFLYILVCRVIKGEPKSD